MVDKRYTVNSARGIYAEDRVDTVRLQQLPELIPSIMRTHGIPDALPQAVERTLFFQCRFRSLAIFLQSLISDIFPYFTRLERRADTVPVVGHGSVDYSGIVPPIDRSRALLDRDVEPFQQRAQLPVGRTFVMAQARPHDGRDLLLDIPLGIIHFSQALLVRLFLPLDTRMQIVFSF